MVYIHILCDLKQTVRHFSHVVPCLCQTLLQCVLSFVCLAPETTGEGSSDGDKAAKRPLTEEEKLQQVKRSESVHQVTISVIVTIGCCSKPKLVWKFSVFYTCHTKVVILIKLSGWRN